MFPELFRVPFVNVTIKSFGVMMVIGFSLALMLMRRLLRRDGQNTDHITNIALYSLVFGVIGSRVFYVVHHYSQFRGDFFSVFAVWSGGLEYLGGVMLVIPVALGYMFLKKLPVRLYLDILSIGLMLGLSFGRIGCFLVGDCFGTPTECPLGIRFPYNSQPYQSQVFPNPHRNRHKPQLDLPAEYFNLPSEGPSGWKTAAEENKFYGNLKPRDELTEQQLHEVTRGKYRMLPIHPVQLYSSANALLLCGTLLWFRRKIGHKKNGVTFGLMFVFYGTMRFLIEYIRDGNPFEYGWLAIYKGGTVSQNIGIYMVIIGTVTMILCARAKTKPQLNIQSDDGRDKG